MWKRLKHLYTKHLKSRKKKCQILFIVIEIQIKTIVRYHYKFEKRKVNITKDWQHQMLYMLQSKQNFHTLLFKVRKSATTLKNSWVVSLKIKTYL